MKKYLEDLSAVHSWEVSGFPVVRINPNSKRKCIVVNGDFTRNIESVDHHEAAGILRFLIEWMKKPEFMAHHQ